MSLEELRAQVEAEENQPEQEAEAIELEETAEESEGEAPAQEEPDADDFELELAGEPEPQQQKPSAEEALIHKLTKERKKAKVVKDENDSLRQEIAELKALVKGVQQPVPVSHAGQPKFPDLYDAGIDGDRSKYNDAVAKYLADLNQYNNRHSEADNAQAKHKQRVEDLTKNLAIRAAKFATDNKVNVDRVASALERATDEIDGSVGLHGALAYLLDSVGDGSERVAYYIGTNEAAMSQVKGMLKEDPNGLKAIAHMTRLAEKLKPKHSKQISKAPEPDQPLKGDQISGTSAKKLQDLWDKAKTTEDMMKIRKRARELGVDLKT